MIAVHIRPEHIVLAWRDLGPMVDRVQVRLKLADDVRAALQDGTAELWAAIDDCRPIGAVVTKVKPDGRCLLWKIAGERVSEWASLMVAEIEAWARAQGCSALYGSGRRGWAKIVEPMGFVRLRDKDGSARWERKIEGVRHG